MDGWRTLPFGILCLHPLSSIATIYWQDIYPSIYITATATTTPMTTTTTTNELLP